MMHHHQQLTKIAKKHGEFEGNIFTFDGQRTGDFMHAKMRNVFNIAQLCDDTVLEIGFNVGNSAMIFLTANPDIKFYAVDVMIHRAAVLESVAYLNKHFNNRVTLFEGDSLKVIPSLDRAFRDTISLYHIDGWHAKEGIQADLKNCYELSKDGAYVICDDTNNKCIQEEYDTYVVADKIKHRPDLVQVKPPHWPHEIGQFVKVELSDSKYYIEHKTEFMGESGHEKIVQLIIDRVDTIQDTMVIGIDVGANVGKYIPNIRKICKEKTHKILCIEPNPLNFNLLQNNTSTDLLLFNTAVSDKEGTLPFYSYHDKNYAGNTHGGLFSSKHGSLIANIDVTTLDSLVSKAVSDLTVDNYVIKFIKIDTEGHDTMIVKGMEKILPKTKYIVFECSDCLDDIRGPGEENPMENCVSFLDTHGFDVYRLGTKRLLKVNGVNWNNIYEKVKFWSNCFAIKKDDQFIHQLIDSNGYII
jgi:FkbM family methyltransferase